MNVRGQVLDHASAAITGTADPTWLTAMLPPHTMRVLGLRSPAPPPPPTPPRPSSSSASSAAHARASAAAAAELPPVLFRGLAAVVPPTASLVVRASAVMFRRFAHTTSRLQLMLSAA